MSGPQTIFLKGKGAVCRILREEEADSRHRLDVGVMTLHHLHDDHELPQKLHTSVSTEDEQFAFQDGR